MAVAVAAIVACGCAEGRPPSSAIGVATSGAEPSASTAAPDLPLDVESQELLSVIRGDERVLVTVETASTADLEQSARATGFLVEVPAPGEVITVEGPLDRVLQLVGEVPSTSVDVQDPTEALRPIDDARPTVEVPVAGRPYAFAGFAVDLTMLRVQSPQREPMLRSLAEGIQTIDGRAYARLTIDGGCTGRGSAMSCQVTLIGYGFAAGRNADSASLTATAATGFRAAIDPASSQFTSVPRPIMRDAEWIARHDDAALARIRTYSIVAWTSWDPVWAGRITIGYERPCASSVVPAGIRVADTGSCADTLAVQVDLRSGSVTGIRESSGP